jgi:DNA polymerase III subunit delta'
MESWELRMGEIKQMNKHLPWHGSQWRILQNRSEQDQLPHALLLTGHQGVGKELFAKQFASYLLCSDFDVAEGQACGVCKNCQLIKAGNYSDWLNVFPEEKGRAIKVDQIRAVASFVSKTAQLGGYKIIIVRPADSMNINAANALLKTLEEPSPKTLIMLITHRLMVLPATVRSRCQIVSFGIPDRQKAIEWLQHTEEFVGNDLSDAQINLLFSLANNAPLKVLELIENNELSFREEIFQQWFKFAKGELSLVELSSKWQKLDLVRVLNHLRSWVMDMIHIRQLDQKNIINQDVESSLKELALSYEVQKFYKYHDELNQALRWLLGQANLNPQLLIEGLLIKWLG